MPDYDDIYRQLKLNLVAADTIETKNITKLIKEYFFGIYEQYYVAGAEGNSEFLFDIAAMSCDPLEAYESDSPEYKMYAAIESELGGVSASAPKSVEKNAIEDFLKLLYAISDQKIFIGVFSVPNGQDNNDVKNARIEKLKIINDKSNNGTEILVVLIRGDHTSGSSRQIKIVSPIEISGFTLVKNQPYNRINNS